MKTTLFNPSSFEHEAVDKVLDPVRAAARRRFAFVTYDFAEYSIRHANGLRQYGDVMLVAPQQLTAPHRQLLHSGVDFRAFHKPRLRQAVKQLANVRWMLQQIREFQPDVIHFQSGHPWFNLSLPWLTRYALVCTIHDPRHHLGDHDQKKNPQRIMDFGYRQADQVIVHGKQLVSTVVNAIGIRQEDVHVIPHIAIGQRDESKATPETEKLILFFGRIWGYKGLDVLIRAQPLINQHVPDAKIVIAGQGEDFARYRQMMTEPDRFIVHNRWIGDDERAELFQRSSVVVLPYVEATQSGVVPVAYTYAKPVVATTTGGLPDVVQHGHTGLLVPPGDVDTLALAIVRLLNDDPLRQQMGLNGRRVLDSEWSEDVIAKQTVEVYERAIARARRRTQRDPARHPV